MPEIKNTFVEGKMNKDLDERLVPKGQYISAMNVEVTTSENSDVGTVQNIYGNIGIDGNNLVPPDSVCVGSVVDDATDSLYWLTATDKDDVTNSETGTYFSPVNNANVIFQFNENNSPFINPVFVDIHQVVISSISGSSFSNFQTQPINENWIYVSDDLNLSVGMSIEIHRDLSTDSMGEIVAILQGNPAPAGFMIIVTSLPQNLNNPTGPEPFNSIEFNSKITGWDTDTLITGVNIVDDMLFWTDNETEPKKINIPRSKEGTFQYGDLSEIKHTHLIVDGNDKGPITESHITVVRPKPTTPINIEMKSQREVNTGVYGAVRMNGRIDELDNNSELIKIGDTRILGIPNGCNTLDVVSFNGTDKFDYQIGDTILVKHVSSTPSIQHFPLLDYHIKAKVTAITNNNFDDIDTEIKIFILDVNYDKGLYNYYPNLTGPSHNNLTWCIQKELYEDQLFELKFPRFSYRWKFEDGEYSTFAPWSDIAFLPGEFKYLPKEGFNIGMVNSLRELTLFDFVAPDTPFDAIQIDLLYKESDSPNVYIVDTIKPSDVAPIGLIENSWNSNGSQGPQGAGWSATLPKGKYKVTSDTIFATVSPNQLIRNWDAVPRRALAQEVVGNRLIYANYTRNFDLEPAPGWKFKQDLTLTYKTHKVEDWNYKSVKTIREYQVGVVYVDKHGRETPVFTNNDSTVSIPKIHSSKSNILYSKLNHFAPKHANAYKFYIKENSNKYHNLIMDRWYDAEDGDIWLSFNSHDRNKITEETFLYLKRGHDGKVVSDNYRYKVLAIENEAPEFVRNVRKQFGVKPNQPNDFGTFSFTANTLYDTSGINIDLIIGSDGSLPKVGRKSFRILKEVVDESSWQSLNNIPHRETKMQHRVRFLKFPTSTVLLHNGDGAFHFQKDPVKVSSWYNIDKVSLAGGDYIINLGKEIGNDCLFVLDSSQSQVEENIAVEIAEEVAENLPEFDGRFFVKVIKNSAINAHITDTDLLYVTKSQPLHYFNQPDVTGTGPTYDDPNNIGLKLYKEYVYDNIHHASTPLTNPMSPADDSDFKAVQALWVNYFGDGTVYETGDVAQPKWFIDDLKFAGTVPTETNYPNIFFSWNLPPNASDGVPSSGNGVDDVNRSIDISFGGVSAVRGTDSTRPLYHISGQAPSPDDWHVPFWPESVHDTWMEYWELLFQGNTTLGSPKWGDVYGPWLDPGSVHPNETEIVDNFVVGGRFRFNEDEEGVVYTITAVEVYDRWNYLDQFLWLNGQETYTGCSFYDTNVITVNGVPTVVAPYYPCYATGMNNTDTFYDPTNPANVPNLIGNLGAADHAANNRRVTFRLFLDKAIGDNLGYDPTTNATTGVDTATGNPDSTLTAIEFLDDSLVDIIDRTSETPAIWETEPDEKSDLDIFWEASKTYPLRLTPSNISNIFSIGDELRLNSVLYDLDDGDEEAKIIAFSSQESGAIQIGNVNVNGNFNISNSLLRIYKKDESANYIELRVHSATASGQTAWIKVETNTHKWGRTLNWFNSYSFGNGVESDTIRDDFNQVEIGSGVAVSTTVGWQYEEETLKSGLIFSGLYNAKTGLNDLNQFIEAENITKDLNPSYGSIQKLHTRDSDLVAFCEDKVLKILASKDALYNADETPNLISAENVLGQTLPFIGDFGISKNPESFARENFRSYFTDKKRGAVLRLSRDGLTPISLNGMKDWFRDNLKDNTDQRLYGSYDNHKSHYNLSPVGRGATVVFNEASNGWVSFKSFIPEGGESMNNDYFTFKEGKLFKHHVGPINTFYGGQPVDSSISFVFNEDPSIVKSFTTINYEGTQSKVLKRFDDSEYTNLNPELGWYVSSIETDKQEGKVKEFVEKEGKWFNYIMGESTDLHTPTNSIDEREFSFQGVSTLAIDFPPVLITDTLIYGCNSTTNPLVNILTGPCP